MTLDALRKGQELIDNIDIAKKFKNSLLSVTVDTNDEDDNYFSDHNDSVRADECVIIMTDSDNREIGYFKGRDFPADLRREIVRVVSEYISVNEKDFESLSDGYTK